MFRSSALRSFVLAPRHRHPHPHPHHRHFYTLHLPYHASTTPASASAPAPSELPAPAHTHTLSHIHFQKHLHHSQYRAFSFFQSPSASSSSSSSRRRYSINDLEQAANLHPHDARFQLLYYQELLRSSQARVVVSRFESDSFASDTKCYLVYLQAKTMLGLDKFTNSSPASASSASSSFGSNENPFYNSSSSSSSSSSPNSPPSPSPPSVIQVDVRSMPHPDKPFSTLMEALKIALGLSFAYLIYRFLTSNQTSAGGGGGGMSALFGSSAKEYKAGAVPAVTFDDVKGCDEAKSELEEIVKFLKDPKSFSRLGGNMPKGVLLLGPPGTGKTLLAKAVAGEAGVPFFFASGSEFEEMFVGVGARRIRDLFAAAAKKQPAIIFIDEIDSVGSKRQSKDIQAARMSLNELLVQLDGFTPSTGVVVIGATNFASLLDPALVRPGRFDKHVSVGLPDVKGRKDILALYASKVTIDKDVDLNIIARGTPGMTGADLHNLMNSAAIRAATLAASKVELSHLEWAKDRILMGAERTSHKMSEQDRKLTAYHEGGHALVALSVPGAMPIHKATILPRGQSLGMVTMLPEGDVDSQTRREMVARLAVLMGGRVAEELIFGRDAVTSGASSDFEQATRLARAMVTKYGMVDSVGVVSLSDEGEREMSPEVRHLVDTEIKNLLDAAYERATNILKTKNDQLHLLAQALLKHETLNREEIVGVINGEEPKEKI